MYKLILYRSLFAEDKPLDGNWFESPLDMLGDLTDFEQGLFSFTSIKSELDKIGCSPHGGYIAAIYVDMDSMGDMVLHVDCDEEGWLYLSGMPPVDLKMYDEKPM